jgi:uncharacterized protein (DUF924 family)/TolB-like protein/class 3 adenylate cyclase/Flp pilus assembly protein TadD
VTEKRLQRRLAAIAIADVVGFSRMMGQDEAGTLAALSHRRKWIVDPVVRRHDGRIVKVMGDGVLLEFGSAINAVNAAMELHQRMAAANVGVPADRHILLRMGINLGDVIVEGTDVYGEGVNIAARLESMAPVGGTVISGGAFDQVRNKVAATLEDLGPQSLKKIGEPVRVYRVVPQSDAGEAALPARTIPPSPSSSPAPTPAPAAATPQAPLPPPPATGERLAIAILPFANLGGDPEQGYFSDGVTEDLITELSRWRMFSVRSRSASFQYRGVALDLREVARALDVRFLVEGSVRRLGDRVRITAQLIDTLSGSHVWAEKYDRDARDIFAVQDEVVRTFVGTLAGRVQSTDAERAGRKPPSSLAAYECVLKGNALPWVDPDARAEATRLFRQAITLDPTYGRAHAVLAAILDGDWQEDTAADAPALPGDEAHALAHRAVEMDPADSTCFSMLAYSCLHRRRFEQAERHGRRAVELNPTSQWNQADLGGLLLYLGQAEEALGLFRKAREIDPFFDPTWYWRAYGTALLVLGRDAEALATFGRANASHYRLSALMAACHARLGDADNARRRAAECMALNPRFSVAWFVGRQPFQDRADADALASALRLAGLPDVQAGGEPAWVGDVLRFWLEECTPAQWFQKDAAFDAALGARFGELHARLAAGREPAYADTARGVLAAVIVLDQFSRNLHRGHARAFANDDRARALARVAIDRGDDAGMTAPERMFLYLPFQHSESPADQHRSVALFEALGVPEWTGHAIAHRDLIARFGRFPHRNAVLGRASTPEELDALAQPGNAF